MTQRKWITAYVVIVFIALLRVGATYRIFSQTSDEPVHLAAGYDWLTGKPYTLDIEHPPLARVLAALPAWIGHWPAPTSVQWVERGNDLLASNGRYLDNLASVRRPNLVFLIIGAIAVVAWSLLRFDPATAFWALLFYTTLPPILGLAGFATTDLAVAATLVLALFALDLWADRPSWRRAAFLGCAIGAGLLAKFSFVVFFPCCALILVAARRPAKEHLRQTAAALLISPLIVWAGYRFAFGTIAAAHPRGSEIVALALHAPLAGRLPMPAPLFAAGILEVKLHDERGHGSFLFGRYSRSGWWYYFPVVLFFKSPIPFLLLATIGARRAGVLAILPLGVLLPAMTSSINIGVRHILPIYPLLAIVAACGVVELWSQRLGRLACAALLLWYAANSVMAQPDFFAWFNEAAGRHPERLVVDSDIDWGQDVLRLAQTCERLGIRHVAVDLLTSANLDVVGLPPREPLTRASRGWIAVSEDKFYNDRLQWLDRSSYQRIGRSIRLYRF